MLKETTQIIAAQLPQVNSDLAKAAPERVHEKAAGVVVAVIWGGIAVALLVGAGVFVFYSAKNAILQKTPLTVRLVATLILPFAPGGAALLFATLRLDPDAGGVVSQIISFFGAIWRTFRPGNGQ